MTTRSFRAPGVCYRTLAVGLCLIAAAGAAAPAQQPTTTPVTAEAGPANVYQRVKVFDFDERPLGNYEDTPMYWTRLTGPGLPAYSPGRIDEQTGHRAAPSFLLTLRGGNIAYEYAHDDLAISPDTDYLVEGYVRAEGLQRARAFIACYLVDQAGRRIAGSEGISALVRSGVQSSALRNTDPDSAGWQRVEIAVPGRFPDAAALRLQLWVLQSYVYEPLSSAVDPIIRQDVNARVWFDDIAVERLPRLRLSLSNPGGLVKPGASETFDLSIHNATPATLRAALTVQDGSDAERFRHEFEVAQTAGKRVRVPLPELSPGLYRARVRLIAGDQALIERVIRFAVLPELPENGAGAADLGVDLGAWPQGDPGGAAELIEALGCGAVKVGVPMVGLAADGAEAELCRPVRDLARRLAMHQVETTGVILAPDAAPSDCGRSTARMVASDPDWDARVGPMLAYFGGQIADWQLGDERRELRDPGGWNVATADAVRRTLSRYLAVPHLIVPQSVLDAPPATILAAVAGEPEPETQPAPAEAGVAHAVSSSYTCSFWLPADLPARALPWHLAFWFDRRSDSAATPAAPARTDRGPAHWLSVELDRRAGTPTADRIADMARRIVLAKAVNPERLYVTAPFELSTSGGGPTWQPTEEYIPMRALLHQLAGLRATSALPLGDDAVGLMFSGRGGHILIAWTWRQDAKRPPVELCLGPAITGLELSGAARPLEHDGPFVRVPLSPAPLIIPDVDAPLLLTQRSFHLEPTFIESHNPKPRPVLTLRNHHPQELIGTIQLHAPESWEVSPNPVRLRLAPGEVLSQMLDFELPLRQVGGERELGVDVRIQHPRPIDLHFTVPLMVGLKGLTVHAAAWWDGDDLVVEQSLRNDSAAPVSFTAFCQPPARTQLERVFLGVMAGEARVERYRFASARDLAGSRLWFGIEEIGGRRRLDQLVPVPP